MAESADLSPRSGATLDAAVHGIAQRVGVATAAVVGVLFVGLLLRVMAALILSPHIDEPSSLLAAHAVAERGLPILPSGTVYFQGATLSFLLQPLLWIGLSGIEHLAAMRMVLALAGTITVYVCYRLALAVTGDARVGLVMSFLVAIDPISVQWSGHLRMYGLLQAFTVALAWAFVLLLREATTWRHVWLVAGLYWVAVFTHIGASLLGPAMALAAVIVFRRDIWRQVRVLVALALSAIGPVALLLLNSTLSTSNGAVREGSTLWRFVGDNLLAPFARLGLPSSERVAGAVAMHSLYWSVPTILVAGSTLFLGRRLLRDPSLPGHTRSAVVALLSLYWLPLIVIVVVTISIKERHLLHLHMIGYVFAAMLVVSLLWGRSGAMAVSPLRTDTLVRRGGVAISVLAICAGLFWRLDNPVAQPDYNQAMAYVADHHLPGEPVIITLPPVGYLSMEESIRDDVVFLAGTVGWQRADRYTRGTTDGRLIDYWIGADSIVSSSELHRLLESSPTAWIIADENRLEEDWSDDAGVGDVIRQTMFPTFLSDGGAVVFRTVPAGSVAPSDGTTGATCPIDLVIPACP